MYWASASDSTSNTFWGGPWTSLALGEIKTLTLDFDAADYALPESELRATKITSDGRGEVFSLPPKTQRELDFPPQTTWAWEITDGKR